MNTRSTYSVSRQGRRQLQNHCNSVGLPQQLWLLWPEIPSQCLFHQHIPDPLNHIINASLPAPEMIGVRATFRMPMATGITSLDTVQPGPQLLYSITEESSHISRTKIAMFNPINNVQRGNPVRLSETQPLDPQMVISMMTKLCLHQNCLALQLRISLKQALRPL